MLETLIRSLALWRLACLFGDILYPALMLVALVILGHLTGLIALPD